VIPIGSLVILHLANPTEKLWGVLEGLEGVGVTFRGLSLDAFEDWVTEVARREPSSLGLATMFVPLFRIERIFLDEQVGAVESYRQRFERRVGMPVEAFLGLRPEPETGQPPS
jgi:hypothetical protein